MENGMKRGADGDSGSPFKRARSGGDVELRMLIQSKAAGSVIGKGGHNITKLRNDNKATVTVPDCPGPERMLTVVSDADTVLKVLEQVMPNLDDVSSMGRGAPRSDDADIHMLVHQSQVGSIIGRAGFKIKELREKTGAQIKVYSTCCPQSTDRVVQIQGKPDTCLDCIQQIIELLESSPIKGLNNPYDPHNYDDFYSHEYGGYGDPNARGARANPALRGNPMGPGGMGPGMGGGPGGMRGGRGGRFGPVPRSNMGSGMGGPGRGFGRDGPDGFGMSRSFGGARGGGFGGRGESDYGDDYDDFELFEKLPYERCVPAKLCHPGNVKGLGHSSSILSSELCDNVGHRSNSNAKNFCSLLFTLATLSTASNTASGGSNGLMKPLNQGQTSTNAAGQNTTQVTIPKDLAGAIIGKGGARIRKIRSDSGANITIDEALPGSTDRIITISGTQTQIQMAQYLLQQSVRDNSPGVRKTPGY